MNLTLHIIRKDLRRFRWALAVWALSLLYLLARFALWPGSSGSLPEVSHGIGGLIFGLLSLGLIGGIVHEDHPSDERASWRIRPISPGRLAAAKMIMIVGLFVGLPLLAVSLQDRMLDVYKLHYLSEYCLVAFVFAGLATSVAATSAITKSIPGSFLMWAAIVLLAGALAAGVEIFAPRLAHLFVSQLNVGRALVLLAVGTISGVAAIVSQYWRHRLTFAIATTHVVSAGAALVGTIWAGYYFY